MIKTGPLDPFLFHQLEDGRHLVRVVPVDRKAQAHLLTLAQAIPDAPQGPLKGSLFPAESIVNLSHAVEADANVTHPDFPNLAGGLLMDQGAVGGKGDANPLGDGIAGEIQKVGAGEGFSPRKQDERHAGFGEVVDDPERLLGRELPGVFPVFRLRVTVHAAEVAGAGDVPDDDGARSFVSS